MEWTVAIGSSGDGSFDRVREDPQFQQHLLTDLSSLSGDGAATIRLDRGSIVAHIVSPAANYRRAQARFMQGERGGEEVKVEEGEEADASQLQCGGLFVTRVAPGDWLIVDTETWAQLSRDDARQVKETFDCAGLEQLLTVFTAAAAAAAADEVKVQEAFETAQAEHVYGKGANKAAAQTYLEDAYVQAEQRGGTRDYLQEAYTRAERRGYLQEAYTRTERRGYLQEAYTRTERRGYLQEAYTRTERRGYLQEAYTRTERRGYLQEAYTRTERRGYLQEAYTRAEQHAVGRVYLDETYAQAVSTMGGGVGEKRGQHQAATAIQSRHRGRAATKAVKEKRAQGGDERPVLSAAGDGEGDSAGDWSESDDGEKEKVDSSDDGEWSEEELPA
jgi:hypothetical protein